MATPRALGFRMPAEWTPHARCWMAWPCRPEIFGARFAGACRAYAEVARAVARSEPVSMIARPEVIADASLASGRGVSVVPLEHDDSWTRDTAPTFVVSDQGEVAAVVWRYDGYGGRSPVVDRDAGLAARIADRQELRTFAAPLVMEGGAVHSDGDGTALVCTRSLLDPRRNPGLDRATAEGMLRDHLGVDTVIWLDHAFVGDATVGHVDNLAAFAAPGRVLALSSATPDDPNHAGLLANIATLEAATDARGRRLDVVPVMQPRARFDADGRRLTTSYINFYIANGAVVLPLFDDPMDDAAFATIAAAFPGREAIGIDALDLVHGGGGIHCITQQQPAPPA